MSSAKQEDAKSDKVAYENVVRGALRFKGDKQVKKKAKKRDRVEAQIDTNQPEIVVFGDEAETIERAVDKTDTEKKFEEKLEKRKKEEIQKLASKSYREKIEEMNKNLAKLADYKFDLPKIGPG